MGLGGEGEHAAAWARTHLPPPFPHPAPGRSVFGLPTLPRDRGRARPGLSATGTPVHIPEVGVRHQSFPLPVVAVGGSPDPQGPRRYIAPSSVRHPLWCSPSPGGHQLPPHEGKTRAQGACPPCVRSQAVPSRTQTWLQTFLAKHVSLSCAGFCVERFGQHVKNQTVF